MSTKIRRNSSKPYGMTTNRNGSCDNGILISNGNGTIPNVMTSPAIFTSEDMEAKHFRSHADDLADIEEDSFTASSVTDVPKPPDGGWGWMVVLASFMIHVLADGITYTLGIYVVELKKAFKEGSGSVSFIPSILVGITLGCGPIASMLVNKYGCRVVTIMGAVLASFGMAVSAAANSLLLLYLSIGICTGLGFGLIYLPAIVCVSMYFEKKRAFATGIAVCGSGLGTFIWAPLTQTLVDNFGWKISFLITGAILLLNVMFGALFRPLPNASIDSGSTAETPNDLDENEAFTSRMTSKNHSFCSDQGFATPEIKINGEPFKPLALQVGNGQPVVDGKYSQMARLALSHPVLPSHSFVKAHESYGSHSRIYDTKNRRSSRRGSGVMLRRDILFQGSLYNIPEYKGPKRLKKHKRKRPPPRTSLNNPRRYSRYHIKENGNHMTSVAEMDEDYSSKKREEVQSNAKNVSDVSKKEKICCIPISSDSYKGLYQMLNLNLLKDGIFVMFLVSNFFTSIGFNVPYVYTVDRAVHLGVDQKDASFLLSVVGIANTLGRICLGYISDRPWINRLYLYNISLSICGISMGLSNLWGSYSAQAFFCAVFGITSGAYVGLTSVVLVDLLGLDNLTNAFGLLLLFQGIASVIGPPFIGWLYDELGNYESGFYFSGAMIFISGVMLFILPKMQRNREKIALRKENEERGFPEIVEEEEEKFDPDDGGQMTMEAKK